MVGNFIGKSADDGVTIGPDAVPGDRKVSDDLFRSGQKVKGGAVMPEIKGGIGVE